jgi:hypothetical protein
MRPTFRFVLLGLPLLCLPVACGGNTASVGDEETNDELRTGSISAIEVRQSAGFMPPPPGGGCLPAGRWKVDFSTKHLSGQACLQGVQRTFDRELTAAEFTQVKQTTSKLRTVPSEDSCPTDIPVASVDVTRGGSSVHYVDVIAACHVQGQAVASAGLSKLVILLRDLSATGDDDGDDNGDVENQDLGELDTPGATLNGKTYKLARGASLSFTTAENQIRCVRDLAGDPADAVSIKEEVVRPREGGLLGGSTLYKRTIKVTNDAEVGSSVKITSGSCFQVRNDADWNLNFKIKVK